MFTHIVRNVKTMLCNFFDKKSLGEMNLILGIKTTRTEKGASLI